ncbi:MAG: glycosyltransferase [Planctomycetota bacterium]
MKAVQLVPAPDTSVDAVAREYARALGSDLTTVYLFRPGPDGVCLDLPESEPLGGHTRARRQLAGFLDTLGHDALLCHRNRAAELAAGLPGPRPVYVVHGARTTSSFVAWKKRRRAKRRFHGRFDFVTVSGFLRDRIREQGLCAPDDRVGVVPNSIDVDALASRRLARDAARRELGVPDDAFVYGSIGKLSETKDPATLVRAHARLQDASHLVLIGDGPRRDELAAPRVHLPGHIPDAARLLPAFDCFVFASRRDAFGLVLLEAMASRIPVIARRAGGVPEVVGDTGVLVEDEDGFVAAMGAVDESRTDAAYARVRAEFGRSRIGDYLAS